MMVTGYSHTVHGLKLGEIMHKNMHLLPEHLRGQFILVGVSRCPKAEQPTCYVSVPPKGTFCRQDLIAAVTATFKF
eukprot:COSAG05_NODE_581_length_8548_cov_3.360279_5_plen_76_part_00